MSFASFVTYYSEYRNQKSIFNKRLAEEIKALNKNSKDVFWEFTPTHFRFQNYKHNLQFIWDAITYCVLEDKYLYITAMINLHFVLDNANIDPDSFQKTLDYLKNKSTIKAL